MGQTRPDSFTNPKTGEVFQLSNDGTITGRRPTAEPVYTTDQQSLDKFDLSQLAVTADTKTLSEQLGFTNKRTDITSAQIDSPKFDNATPKPSINLSNGNTFTAATVGNATASLKVQPFQTASYGRFDDPNGLKIVGTLGKVTAEVNPVVVNGTVKKNQQLSPVVGVQFDKTTSLKASFTNTGALTQVEGETVVGSAAVNLGVRGFNKQTQTAFLGVKGPLGNDVSGGLSIAVDLDKPDPNLRVQVGVSMRF
jgi:hypothetical protein